MQNTTSKTIPCLCVINQYFSALFGHYMHKKPPEWVVFYGKYYETNNTKRNLVHIPPNFFSHVGWGGCNLNQICRIILSFRKRIR